MVLDIEQVAHKSIGTLVLGSLCNIVSTIL